jgi:hypothetical protein
VKEEVAKKNGLAASEVEVTVTITESATQRRLLAG